nr:immunoglobulin light chain junction region [Macaca mulatta]
CQHYHTYPQTF